MGIFSRSPQIPEPHVTRTITTPEQIYHPGSPVSGTLTLQSPVQRRILRAGVTFQGTCMSRTWRSESSGTGDDRKSETIRYRDDAPLFRHTQLLQSDFTAQPGQLFSWQFEFTFPWESTNTRGEVYRKDTALSPLYQVLPHSLPPSFARDISQSTYARVEYNVEVLLEFEDVREPYTVRFQQLRFAPYPPANIVHPPFAAHVQDIERYASSRLLGREKSFRQSIKDRFSSSTPSLDIRIKASVMPVVTLGEAFAFFTCVELTNLSDPYAISVPAVNVRFKTLKMQMEDKHQDEVPLNALPGAVQVLPQVGDQKQLICHATFEARLPGDICSTFSTLNINYSSMLRAVLEVEVCGKTFEHKFDVHGFKILPA